MQIHTYAVDGGSPGNNGVIVILAVTEEAARIRAEAHITEYNQNRKGGCAELHLGEWLTSEPAHTLAVAYFHSGEE